MSHRKQGGSMDEEMKKTLVNILSFIGSTSLVIGMYKVYHYLEGGGRFNNLFLVILKAEGALESFFLVTVISLILKLTPLKTVSKEIKGRKN
jgi:hypothetical protein